MSNLVIVESPSKANTIKSYLGSGYKVVACYGHIRDLPKSSLGVDIDNGFAPHYINIRGKGDLINSLRKEAKSADAIYLATDPDREGEAISWHLANVFGIPVDTVKRVAINEITKDAVKAAVKKPSHIDLNLVNAQQTRRILDRIVGYKISPFMWKSIKSGLSAGRVQSVATKIIVDRENEIRAFVPTEYWTIDAILATGGGNTLTAHFYGTNEKKVPIENGEQAADIVKRVDGNPFTAVSVKRSLRAKMPAPPFTTSTMQQEASKRLGFQSARIMKAAQELYEGINVGAEFGGTHGLITYMRTDSLRISEEAQKAAASFIRDKYGDKYCPAKPRNYKSKANAQDAHEAIRPADVRIEPEKVKKYLTPDQYKLYKLIWDRFVASQMESAKLNSVAMDFECSGYIFRSSGYTIAFPGYMAIYNDTEADESSEKRDGSEDGKNVKLPEVNEGELLKCKRIDKAQHFTEPPPRYNEASLIKSLEEKGIGRPSTITPTITTILSRDYVKREGRTLVPTELGEITVRLMEENFPDIVNYKFTANMETELDSIEQGKEDMNDVLTRFWKHFEKELVTAESTIGTGKYALAPEETDIICDKCGSKMVIRSGKYGKFAACPNYPACKNTKPLTEINTGNTEGNQVKSSALINAVASENNIADNVKKAADITTTTGETAPMKCEKCGADMVVKSGKYGTFYACSRYPECTFTKPKPKEIGVACPECGAKVVLKTKGKTVFYSCERYPECNFSSWDAPTNKKCPKCGKMLFRKKGKNVLFCHDRSCGYSCVDDSENTDI
ncbi:MAG: type I DNA topoisomerase [Eubacteriales bacterium]|nr:type I DNA topoisomerase [Eubacteriales bacterium]